MCVCVVWGLGGRGVGPGMGWGWGRWGRLATTDRPPGQPNTHRVVRAPAPPPPRRAQGPAPLAPVPGPAGRAPAAPAGQAWACGAPCPSVRLRGAVGGSSGSSGTGGPAVSCSGRWGRRPARQSQVWWPSTQWGPASCSQPGCPHSPADGRFAAVDRGSGGGGGGAPLPPGPAFPLAAPLPLIQRTACHSRKGDERPSPSAGCCRRSQAVAGVRASAAGMPQALLEVHPCSPAAPSRSSPGPSRCRPLHCCCRRHSWSTPPQRSGPSSRPRPVLARPVCLIRLLHCDRQQPAAGARLRACVRSRCPPSGLCLAWR